MKPRQLTQTELDQIAEEYSAALRRGEAPTVEEYLEKFPDDSGQLAELLSSVAMIEGLKQQSAPGGSVAEEPIDHLDDYTIVREIGRGGMGIVYEALHQSLGRRVAIKVLTTNLLDEAKQVARFRIESRAAARLRHPNIVTVFGVGCTDKHHYFVMDYVEGRSLRDWLYDRNCVQLRAQPTRDDAQATTPAAVTPPVRNAADYEIASSSTVECTPASKHNRNQAATRATLSLEQLGKEPGASLTQDRHAPDHFRRSAQYALTLCGALHYAHSQGVLHRDIKPANLIIDQHGEIWIADFGLAKLTEQHSITMTGDVVGTPQYMPPESFDGTYDVRSEVYGVGLTLFELLTQRPAIEGKNTADTIRKATAGLTESPRVDCPRIPLDLETIVLKALAPAATDRYPSAQALGEDLRRFLNDQPISARRSTYLERALRWARREPLLASLTSASFLLLAALAIVSCIGYFKTQDALTRANASSVSASQSLASKTRALEIADRQRQRAEKNLQVALNAFDQIMLNITERGVEVDAELLGEVTDTTAPNVSPEDAELLQSLLGFFDELAANNSEELLAESAVAAHRAGDIYVSLGQLKQADHAYSEAKSRYERLGELSGEKHDVVVSQAKVMNELAAVAGLRGFVSRANTLFQETRNLLEESDVLEQPDALFQYARAHRLIASLDSRTGRDSPGVVGPRSRRTLAIYLRVEKDLDAIETAIEALQQLVEQHEEDSLYRAELARAYRNKAEIAARTKTRSESEPAVRRSIELLEDLLADNRSSSAIRFELATTLVSTELYGFNQMIRALRADELCKQLLASSPDLPRYRMLRAQSLENLARLKRRAGDFKAAEKGLREAIKVYEALHHDLPEITMYEARHLTTIDSLAELYIESGQTDEAIAVLETALQTNRRGRRSGHAPASMVQLQRIRQRLNRLSSSSNSQDQRGP